MTQGLRDDTETWTFPVNTFGLQLPRATKTTGSEAMDQGVGHYGSRERERNLWGLMGRRVCSWKRRDQLSHDPGPETPSRV